MLMTAGRSILLIVDVQEKLAPACAGVEAMIAKTAFLLKCAERLAVPVLISEQYPKCSGPHVAFTGCGSCVYVLTSQQLSQDAHHLYNQTF